jgi:hypothetical protein
MSARRNALGPNLMKALQLLKFATKQGRELSFTEGLEKSIQVAELERIENGQLVEDLSAHYYFQNLQS